MARLPLGMSWDEFLNFVKKNPNYKISESTGAPILAKNPKEVPKMVPPADMWGNMAARAEQIALEKAERAKAAAEKAKSYLTEPQPVLVNGQKQLIRDPSTGRMTKEYETAWTPGQRLAQGAVGAGAVGGAGYLGSNAAERRAAEEDAARQKNAITPADLYGDIAANPTAGTLTPEDLVGRIDRMPEPAPIPPRVADLVARARANQAAAPRRAAQIEAAAQSPATTVTKPSDDSNFLSRLFSGPDVQSTGREVVQRMQGPMPKGQDRPATRIDWGNSSGPEGSAADFFRADRAMREAQAAGEDVTGYATGGTAKPHKDAALHKALEIIHALIARR